jgi:hypothetical protein
MKMKSSEDLIDNVVNTVRDFMLSRQSILYSVGLSPSEAISPGGHSIYVHKRISDGSVFYVGICKDSRSSIRPYEKHNRSEFWKRIEKKHGRTVHIILSGVSNQFASETEKWLISVFGKSNNGGLLCNITDGGEGTIGYSHTEESRIKMSTAKKGKTGDSCPNSIAVSCNGIRYGSMAEAARHIGVSTQTILNRVKNKKNTNYYAC